MLDSRATTLVIDDDEAIRRVCIELLEARAAMRVLDGGRVIDELLGA